MKFCWNQPASQTHATGTAARQTDWVWLCASWTSCCGACSGSTSSRWSVNSVSDGKRPADVYAPTVTQAVEQGSAAVAALFAHYPAAPAAELQMAIYPWNYAVRAAASHQTSAVL
jgi:hypothetical protein